MAKLFVDKASFVFPARRRGSGLVALSDVTMEIASNQFAVIVGPSGCGKSTLLRLVAGLETPSSGEVRLGSDLIAGPSATRGMVFQNYTLFPWLTVRQNIEFGPRLTGKPANERRDHSDHLLEQVGLFKFADSFPKQLSGGMMQRVAIARALCNDPKILLMDEPFGALDSQTRGLMQELLTRIWSETQKQILFITHDIEEAVFIGERIYVMSARPGRIKEVIDVNLPYPRSVDVLSDPAFIATRQQVLNSIREEVLRAQALQ